MMKKHLTFSQLLHKDKLMMIVSLILAIIIWVLVVYDQGNTEERPISGIPVSVTLTPFASDELNLRIVDGADVVATVYVEGPRSVIGPLTNQDVTVTADTSSVLMAGTHTVPIRALSNGNYEIVKVVGDDGANATIKITCDVIYEKEFPLTSENVELPAGLTISDSATLRFGTPSPSGVAITEGNVTVSGPKTSVNRIERVAAVVRDEGQLSETSAFSADLVAYDADGLPVTGISFLNAEEGKVTVVVPVLHYYTVPLQLTVQNAPQSVIEKVTVNPQTIELWAIPSELDEYLAEVQRYLTVDFGQVKAEGKDVALPYELKKTGSILPFSNNEVIQIDLDISGYTNKKFVVPLTENNVEIVNCPEGYTLEWNQTELPNVVICGASSVLRKMKTDQFKIIVDLEGLSAGYHTVKVAVKCEDDTVWTYYGESGYEAQINLVSTE